MSARRTLLAVVAALVLVTPAACIQDRDPGPEASPSPGPSVSAAPTLPPVGVDCQDLASQGVRRRLTNAADLSIAAVEFGSGPMGVVLAHQSDANMCQWLPYATLLAQEGYRVMAFDFAGFGTSSETETPTYLDDIRTVVEYLRENGAPRVVVIGASMGATMSILAAAAITPPIDGVVAVSPPKVFDGVNIERSAPQLRTPALYIAGADDGDYEVYARDLNEETPEGQRGLLVVQAPEHGVELVKAPTPAGSQVRVAIGAFLFEHLSPPPTTSPPR